MKASERLHHLDFLRAALMFLGVLVHASHADYDLGRYEPIRFVSGSFRMACFFLISGYFAPQLLRRFGTREFLLKRLVTLGVPALFAVFVLNPRALHAIGEYYATAPEAVTHAVNWHLHVWFLFVLSLYALAALPLRWAMRALTRPRAPRVNAALQASFTLGLICACSIVLKSLEKWGPLLPGYGQCQEILEPAVEDLPYFAFGFLMGMSTAAFNFAHRRTSAWCVGALGLLGVRYVLEKQPIATTPQHLLHLCVDYSTAFACSFALLGSVQRLVTEPRRWVRLTSESAYTVYIVHYALIAECLLQAQRLGLSVGARALSAAIIALGGGLAAHFLLVRRFPVLAFLLNGRTPALRPLLTEAPKDLAPPSRPSHSSRAPARDPVYQVLPTTSRDTASVRAAKHR